jgi:transcriptional regulator with XRE-family HTH domain
MITGQQVKAARTLLGWTQPVLAAHSGVSGNTVSTFERGRRPRESTVMTIRRALERAGVEFPEGEPVRMGKRR